MLDAHITALYPEIAGPLINLAKCTRHDIGNSVLQLPRGISKPAGVHLTRVKCLQRHLKEKSDLSHVLKSSYFQLKAYYDAPVHQIQTRDNSHHSTY